MLVGVEALFTGIGQGRRAQRGQERGRSPEGAAPCRETGDRGEDDEEEIEGRGTSSGNRGAATSTPSITTTSSVSQP